VHETLKDIQKKPVVVIRDRPKEKWHIVKVIFNNYNEYAPDP
jgi:hypothetical protein